MRSFIQILINNTVAAIASGTVWFALTFWAFLETQSVLSTSIISGLFLLTGFVPAFWFGSIVDHHRKKSAMLISSAATLAFFTLALLFYLRTPSAEFTSVTSWEFWCIVILVLCGAAAGNIRNIAVPTLVTILIPEDRRDKANGLLGMTMGISMSGASFGSGLLLAYTGMRGVLFIGIACTLAAMVHLAFVPVSEKKIVHTAEKPKKIDIRGTIKVISRIKGLFTLIVFTTFNNLLGGVFMALMDAYGLSLMPLQAWGISFGFLSLCFIVGGMVIAKFGLGKNPLRTLLLANVASWTTAMLFTIQPWIVLLLAGMMVWMTLSPITEATEQTIVQKVVPLERQGRVFGFAHSVEQMASPVTAFLIGPVAHFLFIPFMTTGAGVDIIGQWFGTGTGRGIALVFTVSGALGLLLTLLAFRSRGYRDLSEAYRGKGEPVPA